MKDTLETNLPSEETGKLEEIKNTAEMPEVEKETTIAADTAADEMIVSAGKLTKEEILEKLTELVASPAETSRGEADALKQAYYKIRRNEIEDQKKAYLAEGGDEKSFIMPEDETENRLKDLLAAYKEKRATIAAEEERIKAENYAAKLAMIERLKGLTESHEDFNKLYNDFKEIQQQWKEVKIVPAEYVNELWKNYQLYMEKFYDIIKINNEFRDYDFKKNLELKTALCETVEKLGAEPDVLSAFYQLQKLHQQWREIGPVAKELREEIWVRFKAASTIINKKYQAHFERLKEEELENLNKKTAICETIENIDFDKLKTFKDWETAGKEIANQVQLWKTIGFAPKKNNVKIFERFRAACDAYYDKKAIFYKSIKGEMEANMELKKALCEKAEALKDSTEWRATTDKMISLQKEWKNIGPVARKSSEQLWKRFVAACDYFFAQKEKHTKSQRNVEKENLEKKHALIEKIKAIPTDVPDDAIAQVKEYIAEWNTIGYVPLKEKDKTYQSFHDAVDAVYTQAKAGRSDRRMQNFRSNLTEMSEGKSKNKLYNERDRLMRLYDRLKNEVQTYENNIGFLSVSSKGGDGLVKEMNRKIEKLKEDMALTIQKIEAIDENLD